MDDRSAVEVASDQRNVSYHNDMLKLIITVKDLLSMNKLDDYTNS